MAIPTFKFTEPTEVYPNNPFPLEISEDPMVLYHGTSSKYEFLIEKEGFKTNKSEFTLDEIKEVCTLFEHVHWPNKKFWSESNLRNYTLKHDFANSKLKPIYFGECSERASLYSSFEFAGGEIARAIRKTFKELNALISDPNELQKELQSIEREFPFSQKRAENYDLSLDKLQAELVLKDKILEKAELLKREFEYGIIYAVKFKETDIPFLEHSVRGGMGVKCFDKISEKQIIAKAIVPKEYIHNINICVDYWELPSWNGILSLVSKDY